MARVEHLSENVTLYLGDCREILPKLSGIDHVITDPPYEARLHDAKENMRKLRKDKGPELKPVGFAPIDVIRNEFVSIVSANCNQWLVAFCSAEGVAPWVDAINASSARYKRACVWVKSDAAPQFNGQGPAMGAEMFVIAWCSKGISRWNGGGKSGIYTFPTNNSERTKAHPTEKPRKLMSAIVRDFTNSGELICDPFMGVGTTGVAAILSNRRFIGIELDQRYFDIACKRLYDELSRPQLFIEEPKQKFKQEALL